MSYIKWSGGSAHQDLWFALNSKLQGSIAKASKLYCAPPLPRLPPTCGLACACRRQNGSPSTLVWPTVRSAEPAFRGDGWLVDDPCNNKTSRRNAARKCRPCRNWVLSPAPLSKYKAQETEAAARHESYVTSLSPP